MDARSDEDRLDIEVLDALAGLIGRLLTEAESLAKAYGFPPFVMKALHFIDAPLAMKELGSRMRCDPSFITCIADTLERHGLAARESDPADRRVKRLVLTAAGAELKDRVERELAARMPWRETLTREERTTLMALLHKMIPPAAGEARCPAGPPASATPPAQTGAAPER